MVVLMSVMNRRPEKELFEEVALLKNIVPSLVRHIHDLALLKELALANTNFSALVSAPMQEDDRRSKNNPLFAGLPKAEKFRQLLAILETEKEKYTREYDLFVKGVSYAAEV